MTRLIVILMLLLTLSASAETIQLRKGGNIVTFEYITQDEDTITVQIPGKDAVFTYKWDDLDQDWIKKNNPKIWAERELLTKATDEKKMEKTKPEEVDPFAKEIAPEDTKTILRNFALSIQDGLRGMPIVNIEAACKEFEIDETSFWKAYEELKKTSKGPIALGKDKEAALLVDKTADKPEKGDTPTTKPNKTAGGTKTKVNKGDKTQGSQRSQENMTHEADAKKDFDGDVRPFSALGYLRSFADGTPKSKPTWVMLRRSTEDRKAMVTMLRKYETMSGELAEKTPTPSVKSDALVLKKAFGTVADTLEKVNREATTLDPRLQQDCGSLLTKVTPLLK